jgi:hypothetical protein
VLQQQLDHPRLRHFVQRDQSWNRYYGSVLAEI